MMALILGTYFACLLAIGLLSHRVFRGTGKDYYTASHTIGPVLLLLSLFGTNMTAFSILGASAEAYQRGIGVFALMASSSAIVIPLTLFFVATKVWRLGRQLGFTTQAELFRARYGSDRLGLLLFVVLTALLIPYLLIGVMGAGLTLARITGGAVPPWQGGLLITTVVMVYVTWGGLRGTAWANAFQTVLFVAFGSIALSALLGHWGGLENAFRQVAELRPDLLVREGKIAPLELITYSLIPLSAGMFPHLFINWLSARSAGSFKVSMVGYPLCMVLLWLPSVALGVLARIDYPDLKGPQVSGVVVQLMRDFTPEIVAGLLAAGVLAAVMSFDSQVLAASNMFLHDVVRHYGFHDRMSDSQVILAGRGFVVGILALVYGLSLWLKPSIFAIAVWSFSGYAALFPLIVAALYWKRSTAAGAIAATLTVVGLFGYFLWLGVPAEAGLGKTGILPVAVMIAASTLVLVVVSLLTRPPAAATLRPFFGPAPAP